jgi:protocatechuate 3,4-dioxygenase beta subunit
MQAVFAGIRVRRRVAILIGAAIIIAVIVATLAWRPRRPHHIAGASDGGARAELAGRVLDRLGRPVGGARVAARAAREPGDGGGATTVANSDEQGHFVLRLSSSEAVTLEIAADGFVTERLYDVVPTQLGLDVSLARKLALEGTVTALGRPVPEAEVIIGGPGGIRRGKSGPDGAFSFAGLAEGRYALRATREAQSAYLPALDVTAGDGGSGVITVALEAGHRLAGKLRARDGKPIGGGEIALSEGEGTVLPRTVASGSDGGFVLDGVLAGDYVLTARAENFYPSPPHPVRMQKTGQTIELRLDPGATIEGRILDERAQPVAGARVEVAGEAPDGTPIAVTALGLPPAPAGESRLEPSGELGILRGPIPYPPVAPSAATAGALALGPAPAAPRSFVSDAKGGFRVGGLPAGKLVVVATHPDFARGSSQPLHVGAGASVSVEVVLSRGVVARGRVSDERGQPLSGATLVADDGTTMTVSDNHGNFELSHVARPLVVSVRLGGYVPAKRTLSPSEPGPFDVQLVRAQNRLAGEVVDDRGFSVIGARIEITAAGMPSRSTSSDGGGHFSVDGLGPGPYHVAATHADFAPASSDGVAAGDGVRLTLVAGGGIDGELRDARSGAVPLGARLTLTVSGKPRTVTLVSGRFSVTSLPPGNATLSATAPGYVAWSRAVDIPPGEHLRDVTLRDIRIDLERGGQLSGRVRDDRGDAAADARITVTTGTHELSTRTDHDGNFHLDGIPPGRFHVTADHDAATAAEDLDIRADDESRIELRLR